MSDRGGVISAARWMKVVLVLAGIYNLAWGLGVIVAPRWWFDVAGIEPPLYPQIWQCVGMIVGVYGVGYLVAAANPLRHWPIVLVGLLGKVLGPAGFVVSGVRGEIAWSFGVVIIFNDLVWWVPFALILRSALAAGRAASWPPTLPQA